MKQISVSHKAYEWLLQNGPSTLEQIMTGLGIFTSVAPRLRELEVKSMVKKSGPKKKNPKGKFVFAWEAIPKTEPATNLKSPYLVNEVKKENGYTCQAFDIPTVARPNGCDEVALLIFEKFTTPLHWVWLRSFQAQYEP